MPNPGQPKKPIGDDLLRSRERSAEADSGEVIAEELRFVELVRAGHADDQAAQRRLFDTLNRVNGAEAAVARMNKLLEPAMMRGELVPVDTSAAVANGSAGLQVEKQRWVSWKRTFRDPTPADGQVLKKEQVEIHASIEKILCVQLRNASLADIVSAADYEQVDADITNELFPFEPSEGPMYFDVIKFDDDVGTVEVQAWLKANGYPVSIHDADKEDGDRGATLKELLSIGEQFPAEQARVYMVALGQGIDDGQLYGLAPTGTNKYAMIHASHENGTGSRLFLSRSDGAFGPAREIKWGLIDRFPVPRKIVK